MPAKSFKPLWRRGISLWKEHHELLHEDEAMEASRLLKAISDPTRIRILHLLSQEECPVGHIAEVLGMSQSAVSHQLGYLRSLRLVKYRRKEIHIFIRMKMSMSSGSYGRCWTISLIRIAYPFMLDILTVRL